MNVGIYYEKRKRFITPNKHYMVKCNRCRCRYGTILFDMRLVDNEKSKWHGKWLCSKCAKKEMRKSGYNE